MSGPPEAAAATVACTVNGSAHEAPAGASVLDLVMLLGFGGRPIAVEVNETVVPKKALGACMIKAGDRIEIVTLVGGG
jgi:sulfur carrier protein